jgi:hypothetical protein
MSDGTTVASCVLATAILASFVIIAGWMLVP